MATGCRYQRAIKQSMNKLMKSRSSVHVPIAEIIADFSHKTMVTPGTYLLTTTCYFFIVQKISSPHWCEGFFCPPRIELTDLANLGRFYTPDLRRRGRTQRKRIFKPFQAPRIHRRKMLFHLESKVKNEPLPHPPYVFI